MFSFVLYFLVIGLFADLAAAEHRNLGLEGSIAVSADAAVVMDVTTGEVVFAKNANLPKPMASTTKIMTAIVVLEQADLNDQVEIDWNIARTEGSSLYTKPGEIYSVRDLLYGLMLQSGNDAAVALARHTAGSVARFVELMNMKARELGLVKTKFANPHGLPAENHYTTAYELALLTRYALHNPEFAELVACKRTTIERPSLGTSIITNKNKLLWEYGADGVKTGYTRAAGRCLVASATRDGRQLVSVVLNAPDMWADSVRMLDYGFKYSTNVQLVEAGKEYALLEIKNGEEEAVPAVAACDYVATVSLKKPEQWELHIVTPRELRSPVLAMQPVGYIQITNGREFVAEIPLVAEYSVKVRKDWLKQLIDRLCSPFEKASKEEMDDFTLNLESSSLASGNCRICI